MEQQLVTTTEAARRLGVSVATVQRWAAKGVIRYAVKLPHRTGAYLFHPDHLIINVDGEPGYES